MQATILPILAMSTRTSFIHPWVVLCGGSSNALVARDPAADAIPQLSTQIRVQITIILILTVSTVGFVLMDSVLFSEQANVRGAPLSHGSH
jgi:hypothetical protein